MGEAIVLGVVLAIIFYELTDVSPGGLIVPGMFAYYLYDPRRLALTLGVSLLVWLLVVVLSKYTILYGKRLFAAHILTAFIVGFVLAFLTRSFELIYLDIPLIGTIIAGILAHETRRQGVVKTYAALAIVTALTGMAVLWL